MFKFDAPDPSALDKIKTLLGSNGWKNSDEEMRYFDDPRDRFTGQGCLIALPRTTDEVAAIVRICNDKKIGIIPYGGGTGVVSGQLSSKSENVLILSLERMNTIRDISLEDGIMIVEAGCILENIHSAAAGHGQKFPLNMASKGSCCIGGNLATNAGGNQVLRYGNARDLCLGIEAVLPDGSILSELSPLRKNNTGYDLRHLLIGSEGTLGIITAATLILKPIDQETTTVLCAISTPSDAVDLLQNLHRNLGEQVTAIELMSDFAMTLIAECFPQQKMPFSEKYNWHLLIEVSGNIGSRERLETCLADTMENGIVLDAVIAESESQRDSLWSLRENIPEANRMTGAICSSDTSVPISKITQFIEQVTKAILNVHPDLRINSYGHIGDGNIHHNVFPAKGISKKEFLKTHPDIIDAVRMAINEVTNNCHGSISAEHGIGRLKTNDLEHYASPTKLALMKTIKRGIDPNGIMNPGALFRVLSD